MTIRDDFDLLAWQPAMACTGTAAMPVVSWYRLALAGPADSIAAGEPGNDHW